MSKVITAKVNNLASLFYHDVSLEIVPEVFRLQKDTYIEVPFQVFCKYVKEKNLPDYIHGLEFREFRRYVDCNLSEAYLYYLRYLAIAQLKEIHFAYANNCMYSTRFIPNSTNAQSTTISNLLQGKDYHSEYITRIMRLLNTKGMQISYPENASEYNKTSFTLATYYYDFAVKNKQKPHNYFNIEV